MFTLALHAHTASHQSYLETGIERRFRMIYFVFSVFFFHREKKKQVQCLVSVFPAVMRGIQTVFSILRNLKYIYINKYLTQPKRNPVIGSSHVAQGEEEET